MKSFRNWYHLFSFLSVIVFISSCTEKTTINTHYIYNTGWAKGLYQGFTIAKIKLPRPMSIYDQDFNKYDLVNYFIDSSFCFRPAPAGNSKKVSKIYFDKKNDFADWISCNDFDLRKPILGALENGNWYIILGIGGTIDYYAYIDNNGTAHAYSLGPTNW